MERRVIEMDNRLRKMILEMYTSKGRMKLYIEKMPDPEEKYSQAITSTRKLNHELILGDKEEKKRRTMMSAIL